MQFIRKRIQWALPVVVAILLVGLFLSRVFTPDTKKMEIPDPEISISASEAINHIGRAAEVCGRVAEVAFHENINGFPTFVNFGQRHPDQLFTVIIWGDDRHRWRSEPHRLYRSGQELCVTGKIGEHEGTPQIRVFHPGQIQVR